MPNKLKYSKQGREELKAAAAKGKGKGQKQPGLHRAKGGATASTSQAQQASSTSSSTSAATSSKSSRPSKGPGSKLAASSSDQHKQRTGFRIGRKPAPGVYTGKADKIKASLIHNAKVKKQYAKMLQREGLGKGLSAGNARSTVNDDSMDVENDEEQEPGGDSIMQEEEEAQAGPSRGKAKRPKRDTLAMQEDIVPPRPILSKRKSSEMERHPDDMLDDEDGAPPGQLQAFSSSTAPNHVHPDRRNDAKGKNRAGRDEIQQPPQKRQRLTEDEIEEKRNERKEKKRDWMKRGRTGQPLMGKRMDVLLGKIEKSVGKR